MDTLKRAKEIPMTVPDLMSTVYLLLGVTWPIIKQNVANIGNRQQCFDGDLRCTWLIWRLLVARGHTAGFRASL